ncbi:MAG: hypothetical protein RR295_06070, partial [Oscillospiraceae bacterium]
RGGLLYRALPQTGAVAAGDAGAWYALFREKAVQKAFVRVSQGHIRLAGNRRGGIGTRLFEKSLAKTFVIRLDRAVYLRAKPLPKQIIKFSLHLSCSQER